MEGVWSIVGASSVIPSNSGCAVEVHGRGSGVRGISHRLTGGAASIKLSSDFPAVCLVLSGCSAAAGAVDVFCLTGLFTSCLFSLLFASSGEPSFSFSLARRDAAPPSAGDRRMERRGVKHSSCTERTFPLPSSYALSDPLPFPGSGLELCVRSGGVCWGGFLEEGGGERFRLLLGVKHSSW